VLVLAVDFFFGSFPFPVEVTDYINIIQGRIDFIKGGCPAFQLSNSFKKLFGFFRIIP
jgi:hypothetical protein